MPRSAVIYTNPDAFTRFKEDARRSHGDARPRPYTISSPLKTDAGSIRVRITELVDGALARELARMSERGDASFASSTDRDVKSRSYDDLLEDADRARTEAVLQLASPAIVEIEGMSTPFPVLAPVLDQYIEIWNAFSEKKIDARGSGLAYVRVADFRISCVATPFGPGSQGWVKLETGKGRTEGEIALFNGLVDFAFYCGTGLHTDEGLGQTRRMEKKG